MLKLNYFLADIFILSAEKQPIKLSWRKIEWLRWMQKLYAKLEELCKDVRVLRNADRVLPEDDNLLDNQDLCLLFKVSIKTLQRYRAIGALPYFTISGKVYYKASDVREFIKERFSVTTLRQFEKEHCTKKKK